MTAAATRILMIGLDSVDVDYVTDHIHSLPRLRRLSESGRFCRLSSPCGWMSASVWPTFYTGQPPEEHGYYYPMQFDAQAMRLKRVNERWLYCEPFWYSLADRGIPITTFDVQTQFPSRISSGVEITNWGAQSFSRLHTNRPDIVKAIRRRFGHHPMRHDIPLDKTDDQRRHIKSSAISGLRKKRDIAMQLMSDTNWRLLITVFAEAHRAGHYLWPTAGGSSDDGDDLLDVLRELDSAVGSLLDHPAAADTTVVVFSVHGMGPANTQMHFMPQLMDLINARFLGQAGPANRAAPPRRGLMRYLRESLPTGLQTRIADRVPEEIRDWVVSRQFGGGIDWHRTPAFALPTGGEGFVRFNLAGRERHGMLQPGSERYREYRQWLVECFQSLRCAATGESLVDSVHVLADEIDGHRVDRLPDVIAMWRPLPPVAAITSELLGNLHCELRTGRNGLHRPEGFAVVGGRVPDALGNYPLTDIRDFAPFVRRAFDECEQSQSATARSLA